MLGNCTSHSMFGRTRYCSLLIEMRVSRWQMMEQQFWRQSVLIIPLLKCLLVRQFVFTSACSAHS